MSFCRHRKSFIRLMVVFIVFVVSAISVFVALPFSTRASRGIAKSHLGAKKTRPAFIPGQVLVRYKNDLIAKGQQAAPRALSVEGRAIQIQVQRFGGSDIVEGLRLARVAPEDTVNAITALKQQPDVLYAEPNYIMHADVTPNDPQFGSQYGWPKIGAPTAWNTTTGSNNVVVGIIDEGIDINHQDLQANIFNNPAPGSIAGITGDLHGYDFFNNTGTISPGDHGTHTSGTVGAVGNNGIGVTGANWQVKLISLKFLDNGSGSDSDAIRACTYAKQMRDLFASSGGAQGANIRVLNNSYGGGAFSQAFLDAINALNQSGILFVASAGNDAVNTDLSPQYPSDYNAPNVISVAATDSADNLASFSNFGVQTVTLGAPGVSILSTTTNNTYGTLSGTSMASPHVAGCAALLLAANPNLTVQQLKSLLIFNGDPVPSLDGKTLTGRRLNIANSMAALAQNDTTAPGAVTNFHVNTQSGRSFNIGWTASGDDGATGQASLYQLSFTDATTGAVVPLKNTIPTASGSPQTLDIKVPYGHTHGTITLREFDKVGNEGTPVSLNVAINFVDGDPYATALGKSVALTTSGTALGLTFDDRYLQNYALPFSFPFFGQNYSAVTISTNGNLYFSTPPFRSNGDADDVPSSIGGLTSFKMIAGLWDDLYLGTDQRADADVYVVQPDASRIIFRWQGVPCNSGPSGACQFGGAPINFEIELRSNGLIQTRYGSGNTNIFPVVGISNGEPDPYVIAADTSEAVPTSLTNAQQVTYIPRTALNPLDFTDFFVSQHYRDFLSREPDPGGEAFWIDQIDGNAANSPPPCASGDTNCLNARRINVSNAFYFELEFQQTGSYVYRMYRAAFGNSQPSPNPFPDPNFPNENLKMPSYQSFAQDRAQVPGGPNLPQEQLALANAFVQRSQFTSKYAVSLSLDQFVDAILATINSDLGVDLTSQKSALVGLGSRGAVLYRLANDDLQSGNGGINNRTLIDAEYNRAFVYTQYAGYLRRDSDIGGFLFWLGQVNSGPLRDITKQHAMVCSFITSQEYQFRFSPLAPHSNGECPH